MSAQKVSSKRKEPRATRPHMPNYGIEEKKTGMLSWKWAADRLSKSRQYWIATTKPDGSPHVMVIWGLWIDGEFWFSTGQKSRKGRNLTGNPHCVICSDNAAEAVIVEGVAELFDEAAVMKRLYAAYNKKYKFDVSGMGEPFYRVRPRIAFGLFEKKFTQTATRWLFSA
jgi:general stress protein 26